MTPVTLKKLFKKETETLIYDIIMVLDPTIGIQDSNGKLLLGEKKSFSLGKYPVELEGEILGWVGMLPMKVEEKGKRFEINYINSADFLDQLSQVQMGSGDVTFVIACTQEELDQFNVELQTPSKESPPEG